jgi:hypothetical protein
MIAPKSGKRSIMLTMTNNPIAQKSTTAVRSELAAESQDHGVDFLVCSSCKVDMRTLQKSEATGTPFLSDFFAAGCDLHHSGE